MKFTNESLKKKKKKHSLRLWELREQGTPSQLLSKGPKKLLARGSYTGDQKIFPPFFWILFP